MGTRSPDTGLSVLKAAIAEFRSFCDAMGAASETDTRVKLIDRVLKEVLGWPEEAIVREKNIEGDFLDYMFIVRNRPLVAVEAKKEGVTFKVPVTSRRTLKLNGTLVSDKEVKAAIDQARSYCDDHGIRYAIATNGYAWIVFRAVRDDMPWREGSARVFASLDHVVAEFTEFWNLLSYEALASGSLDSEFGTAPISSRSLHRVVDRLATADVPLRRNRLNEQLQPIIKAIFEDIASQENLDLFKACYVHSESLKVIARDLDLVITDAVPAFLQSEGGVDIEQTKDGAGRFGKDIESSVLRSDGDLYLLLGGIGSGKTTFLKRYQQVLAKELLTAKAYWFHLDFLAAPLAVEDLETFVWQGVLAALREKYAGDFLEMRRFVKKMFADKIAAIEETALRHVKADSEEYEKAISPFLERWQEDLSDYVPRVLKYAKKVGQKAIVFFIDNVDQLDPAYQAKIFLLAQRVTRLVSATTIVAMREESYYAASIQKAFTAYTSRKFHIASPHFRAMISQRINFAIDQLAVPAEERSLVALRGLQLEHEDIVGFLKIVQRSVFSWSRMLARFIEALCFGNMRMALEMFSTFLTSGASDVTKMLNIYHDEGDYTVAFHEFVKSIMLGDRRYYKEDYSRIRNVFNATAERNSSHFTAWRALLVLLSHRGESSPEGRGYVEIGRLVGHFETLFDNSKDLLSTLDRLVAAQLIEVNTRSIETAVGASHVRVTSAGWYYVRHLAHKFCYLDLVLQDTPLDNNELANELKQSMYDVDNLGDRGENKAERMQVRFERVRKFLEYLNEQEEAEVERFALSLQEGLLSEPIMPQIIRNFRDEREYIESRFLRGRSRMAWDMPEVAAEDEPPEISDDAEAPGA